MKKFPGFTLIELLVVISIIGVLSAIGLTSYEGSRKASRGAQRKAALREVATALAAYNASNGAYPINNAWWGECSGYGSHPRTGANGYIPNLAPDYIDELPRDPRYPSPGVCDAGSSCYLYYSNGTDYKLLAHCTPESYPAADKNPFYDPSRPTWSWQVHSSPASAGW